MARRRSHPAVFSLPIGTGSQVAYRPYPRRAPMLSITTGPTVVALTLPDVVSSAHVSFARQLAVQAAAYATEVERRFRGLAPSGQVAR